MSDTSLAQKDLKEALHYNPETGIFTRLTSRSPNVRVGDIAGYLKREGYIFIGIGGKQYYAHRLAWFYVYGKWPKNQIDHINHNKADNRIINLREVTCQENQRNRLLAKNNVSGCHGVHWDKRVNKWHARIKVNGKMIHLRRFCDFFEACCARKSAENKHGFHKNHGS